MSYAMDYMKGKSRNLVEHFFFLFIYLFTFYRCYLLLLQKAETVHSMDVICYHERQ